MNLQKLEADLIAHIEAANDPGALEDVRVRTLGKKGVLTEQLKALAALPPEEKRERGQALNAVKQAITLKLEEKQAHLNKAALGARLATESIDVTLPARPEKTGSIHPLTQTIEEVTQIFQSMGFGVAQGPDIEDDWHNFSALNIPDDHPARQMHDTFYMPEQEGKTMVLRTHTSPVQIRTMQTQKPPIRIIAPGRTYRSDYDQTHTPMFHQIEGLYIDKAVHMGHLKGCLLDFLRRFFNAPDLNVRLRPSYFPFTEPSAEVDISCAWQNGQLVLGKGERWMEILGCGMVHPKVLQNCGIDAEQYQGFAFGMGLERLAMLKYGIPDLRSFFDSDIRWLKHYGFAAGEVPR